MAVKTLRVGPGKLTIGADTDLTAFESQCTACKLVPSVDNDDPIEVLSGEQVAGDRTESFTLEGAVLQDFGAADSRVEWLFNRRGESHPFTYIPRNDAGKQITGDLQVEAVEIGGDVGTKARSDFEFVVTNVSIGAITVP